MKTKTATLAIGSYSTGTMRPEDLIPTFLSAAEDVRMSKADRAKVRDVARSYKAIEDERDTDTDPSDLLHELFDVLNGYCPAYCYFGAHEGDGADYGVWVSAELLHGGDGDDDVHRSSNTPNEDVLETQFTRAKYAYWLHVNDHGNATLYRRAGYKWIEVWAIV